MAQAADATRSALPGEAVPKQRSQKCGAVYGVGGRAAETGITAAAAAAAPLSARAAAVAGRRRRRRRRGRAGAGCSATPPRSFPRRFGRFGAMCAAATRAWRCGCLFPLASDAACFMLVLQVTCLRGCLPARPTATRVSWQRAPRRCALCTPSRQLRTACRLVMERCCWSAACTRPICPERCDAHPPALALLRPQSALSAASLLLRAHLSLVQMQLGDIVHLFSLSGDLEFASSAASKDGKRRQAFLEYRCDAAAPLSAYQLIMIPLMMLHAPTAGRQHGGGRARSARDVPPGGHAGRDDAQNSGTARRGPVHDACARRTSLMCSHAAPGRPKPTHRLQVHGT